jgi:hypothetical protein
VHFWLFRESPPDTRHHQGSGSAVRSDEIHQVFKDNPSRRGPFGLCGTLALPRLTSRNGKNRTLVRREIDKEQRVKVSNSEGIANQTGPESCVAHREVRDEALTGNLQASH